VKEIGKYMFTALVLYSGEKMKTIHVCMFLNSTSHVSNKNMQRQIPYVDMKASCLNQIIAWINLCACKCREIP